MPVVMHIIDTNDYISIKLGTLLDYFSAFKIKLFLKSLRSVASLLHERTIKKSNCAFSSTSFCMKF